MTRRALLFLHMDDDNPGRFGDFLRADGFSIDTVMVHRGESPPAFAAYDLLLVMGGPMDVWQVGEHPWLEAEKEAIAAWVRDRARPFIGFCLGHQLLAEALGGTVGMASREEIGIFDITLTEAGRRHPVFAGLPSTFTTTQWHHAEIKTLPPGGVSLAASATTPVQALAVGDVALGIQFHAEWKSEFIAAWKFLPSYVKAMETALGPGAHAKFVADAAAIMPQYHLIGRRLYDNVMRLAGFSVPA